MKKIELGLKKFAIRKEYLENKSAYGTLILCKSKTFGFRKDGVVIIYSETGNNKNTFTEETHRIFNSAAEAFTIMSGEVWIEPESMIKEKSVSLKTLELEAMKALVSSTKEFTEESMTVIAKMSKVLAKELMKRNKD